MKTDKMRPGKHRLCLLLVGAVGVFGCANYEPLEYTPASEIRPGPGLFTGNQGVFYIHGEEKPVARDDPPPTR